jgi:outer membrane protein assembly factor BamB
MHILLLVLGSFLTGSTGAGDWPQFRGPDGAGQSDATTVPFVWTGSDYSWRVELPGIGHSSPVIWKDQVFVTSASEDDAARVVRCLGTADGELLWEAELASTTYDIGNATSYDTASPVVDELHLYVVWIDAEGYSVAALDRQTGDEVWRRNLGPFEAQHGLGASPVKFEELLILANDQKGPSFLVALDRRTGETRWKVDRKSAVAAYSTPIIYRPENGVPELIVSSSAEGLSSFDPRSGQLNWALTEVFGENRVVGSPVAAGNLVFAQCGVGSGGKKLVAIQPPVPSSGEGARVVYEVQGSLPYVPTPVAYKNWLFFFSDSGVASCIDIRTGERIWRERVGGNFFGSPVRIGQGIYCISRSGEMIVLAAAPDYRLLGRVDLGEPSHSTPAVSAEGVMIIRTFSHLMAIAKR